MHAYQYTTVQRERGYKWTVDTEFMVITYLSIFIKRDRVEGTKQYTAKKIEIMKYVLS